MEKEKKKPRYVNARFLSPTLMAFQDAFDEAETPEEKASIAIRLGPKKTWEKEAAEFAIGVQKFKKGGDIKEITEKILSYLK